MPIFISKPHFSYSSMPFREEWRINGKLSLESQEALVDYFDDTTALLDEEESCFIHSYKGTIQELTSTLIEEDFLTEAKDLASDLMKNVKGGNKELATDLVALLEQLETTLQQANEYAMEQIKHLKKGVEVSQKMAERFDL